MPESVPKPAPYLKDHEVRQAIEPLYRALHTNESEVGVLLQQLAELAAVAAGERGYESIPTEESTSSTTFGDLDTPGPSATIEVQEGDLVFMYALVDSTTTQGGAGSPPPTNIESSDVDIFEPTDYSSGVYFGLTPTKPFGTVSVLDLATPGTRTYTMKYKHVPGDVTTESFFENRKLWVWTVGGFSP